MTRWQSLYVYFVQHQRKMLEVFIGRLMFSCPVLDVRSYGLSIQDLLRAVSYPDTFAVLEGTGNKSGSASLIERIYGLKETHDL